MNERQTSLKRTFPGSVEVKPLGNPEMADTFIAEQNPQSPMFGRDLMEMISERGNMQAALKRVKSNGGAPGVDGMTTTELTDYLKGNWLKVKGQLLEGTYQPQPVRRVEIPKPDGGTRKLGIPCVVDRLIQQSMLQILQGKWDSTFSENSYGFRPKRSAHQAIAKAQSYLEEGYTWVVDIDLEKFFDRVNHDRLMSTLEKEIEDKRALKLIRGFLNAGVMENGMVSPSEEGTPQGGPLSPLLSNIVLNELDRELESRGHKFARYADDCNIYVRSERAGDRIMRSISGFIARKLKLKVNELKSAVGRPQKRKFLGFSFTGDYKAPNRRKIAPKSLEKFKKRVRQLTNRNHSLSIEKRVENLSRYLRGWKGYFGFCQTPNVLRALDSWIRRRLRSVLWKQWKVYKRRKAELMKRGVSRHQAQTTAWSSKGPWTMAHTPGVRIALPNSFFDSLGLTRLTVTI